ncbi:MAG: acyltransferase [Rhodocyclaceae bacterium]|nr:acyltransferase [Rhodocyclaceae bacterium]
MLGYFRLLAAIGVLVGHVSNFLSNGTSRAMVGAFFIVSGYLIAMTVSENYRGRPMAFYRNRFLRVFPTYWLIAGCTALAGAPWWIDYYEALPQGERLMSVFRTFALCFDDARRLVGPAWSLPYELSYYLLAPLLIGFTIRRTPVGLPAFALLSVAGFAAVSSPWLLLHPFGIGYSSPWLLASFVLFAAGALIYQSRLRLSRRLQGLGLGLLACVIAMGCRYVAPDGAAYDMGSALYVGTAAYAATALVLLSWDRKESPGSKLAGDLCYPVYLLHWPLLNSPLLEWQTTRALTDWFGRLFPMGQIVAACVIGIVATLLLSWLIVLLERRYIAPFRAERGSAPSSHGAIVTLPRAS